MAGDDPFAQFGDAVDPTPTGATPSDPYASAGDAIGPSGSSADDPFAQYGDAVDAAQTQTPDGSSRTQAALNSTEDGTAGTETPTQEVTVVGHRPAPAAPTGPASSWRDTLAAVVPTVAAKFKSRVAGAQEYLGNDQTQDAKLKLWQSMVLPDAVKEAQAAGNVAIYELPQVIEAAKHVGVRPDIFARDWQDYEDMKPDEQEAFYQKQVGRIQAGQEQAQAGQTKREAAASDQRAFAPNVSGFDPKNIAFQALTGVPDLLAGMAVGLGGGAVGGPAGGALAATAYFVGTAAPEEYAEARNQGADHDTASTYATLSALTNAVPEIPVLKAVVDGGVGRKILSKAINETFADSLGGRAVNTAASQALAQTVISAAQSGIDNGVLDKNISLSDALKQMAQQALVGGLSGAPLGAFHGGHTGQPSDRPAVEASDRQPDTRPMVNADEAVDHAHQRLQWLEDKKTGRPGTTNPETGEKEIPDQQPAILTPQERAEHEFLTQNKDDPRAIAHAYGHQLAPTEDESHEQVAKLTGDSDEKTTPTTPPSPRTDDATEKTFAALKSVLDKSTDPGQIEHLENLGLATRNDVGVPRLLPAGRRRLIEINNQKAALTPVEHNIELTGQSADIHKKTEGGTENQEVTGAVDGNIPIHQYPAHQQADTAHGFTKGDTVTIPNEGTPHSHMYGGQQGVIRSIWRYGEDSPWLARVQTEDGGSMAFQLPEQLHKSTGLSMPDDKGSTEAVGGLAPRVESQPLEERLKSDPQLRDSLQQMKTETGWLQKGGNVLMNEDREVIGRTTWIPNHEWFAGKPEGMTEDQVHNAIDKALSGAALGTKQRALIEHMTAESDSRNYPQGQEDFDAELARARSQTEPKPTREEIDSGNYPKGGMDFAGMPVKIESPQGSVRSGTSETGQKWSRAMGRDYGYIDGTRSKDGEGVDVFLAGRPDTGHVYVINQKNPDGSFDETKSVLGAMSKEEAKAIYMSHYPKDWKGFGSIVDMPTQEFRKWANSAAPMREARERVPPRTSDMNEFQLRQALRSHELTGLPNRRAYNEDPKLPYQASLDVDSLKWVNDHMGHESGDNLLKHVAEVLREHVDNLYHISGDEFVAQGEDEAQLHKQLQAAVEDLKTSRIHHEMDDGSVARLEGMGLSYGVGRDLHEAEQHLQSAKSDRETQGLRAARGEKPQGASVESREERQAREADFYAGHEVEHDFISEHQTDFFGAAKVPESVGVSPRRKEGAPAPAPGGSQLQMFTPDSAPAPRNARTASRTQLAEIGRFHSGIKQVRKWQDAAHVFAPLRKSPQESMMALAIDAAGKPLAVLRHSIGDQTGAGAVPHLIIGALTKVPHIAGVYFGHNHPSGEVGQSGADIMITNKLHDLMRGSGIDPLGMIVVGPGTTKASFYHPETGYPESVTGEVTPAPRRKAGSVPVVERRFKRIPTVDMKGRGDLGPSVVRDQIAAAAAHSGDTGLLAYNGRYKLVGHMPMTAEQMGKLRTGSKDSGIAHLAGQLEDMNAEAVIPFGTDETALRNLGTALSSLGVKHLDTFTKDTDGDWSSSEESGRSKTSHDGAFYSRGTGGAGMSREDLHQVIRKTVRDSAMRAAPDFPHVEVHQDFATLPAHLRDQLVADGAQHTVGGIFDPNTGRIHMIADNLGTEQEARETLWHEAVGHHGLRMIMDGDRYNRTMDGIWNGMEDRVRATAQRNGLDVNNLDQRRMAAEEVVAYAAGKYLSGQQLDNQHQGIFNRAVQAVRQFFSRVSGKPFINDADIAKLIGESKRALETGATRQRMGDIARSTRAPTFYSAVERAVEGSKQAKASADQWLATLRKTPGVKAEEMQWLGVEDWLKAHDGPVAKSDLQDFIKANQLHLEETVHGTSGGEQSEAQRKQVDLAEKLRAEGYTVRFTELGELANIVAPDKDGVSAVTRYPDDPGAFVDLPDAHQDWLEKLQGYSKTVAQEALDRMTGDTGYEHPEGWDRVDPQTTRYEDYTLPGGSNYREMLIRKPMEGPDTMDTIYKSNHFPERNVLAHVRFKNRTDAEGKKVLFLEELQSDWHQAGRKKGYASPERAADLPAATKELGDARLQAVRASNRLGDLGFDNDTDALRAIRSHRDWAERWVIPPEDKPVFDRYLAATQRYRTARQTDVVPDAPFKTSWPSLIMKRMIRHAAEGGYDRIAWTTGEQQADRYNLSHHLDHVGYIKNTDGTYSLSGRDRGGISRQLGDSLKPEELDEHVGRDLAAKIRNGEGTPTKFGDDTARIFSGIDLKVGGEGMRGFYDDILPRETNKLIGKFGSKVAEMKVDTRPYGVSGQDLIDSGRVTPDEWMRMEDPDRVTALEKLRDDNTESAVHGFDVTPQMRDAALSQGFPMYWKKPTQQSLDLQRGKGDGWYERVRSAVNHLVDNPLTNDFRKLLAPTTMDEESRRTARLATSALGKLAHNTFETQHALEAFSRQIDRLKPEEQLEMMDAIEHGLPQPNAELQPVADVMRNLLDTNRDKVRGLGMGYLDNFIENYFPHYWADQDEAKRVMASVMGRRPLRGPASFLKMRTIPTIKEGLEAGLTPLTINPLTLTLLKVREMQRFVSGVKMMEDLKDGHLAQFLPAGKPMPQGWKGIDDNIAKVRQWSEEEHGFIERGQYIMPENAARLINNHVGRSALQDVAIAHVARVGTNVVNSMQLGLSAFHLGFTTLDAAVSKNALGMERLMHGEPGRAAQAFLEANTPGVGVVMNMKRGYELLKAYSNTADATPNMQKVVAALEAGGGRAQMDRYYRAVQGGSPFHGVGVFSLAGDIKAALKGPAPVKGAIGAVARFPAEYGLHLYRGLQDLVRTTPKLQIPFEMAGRLVRAGSSLIMEHIVPMQKLGVFADLAQDYLRRNPTATDDQLADAMQSAWRSVDNRLGEMVYDNNFWNRTLKDSMHLGIRAVGWNAGTIREIGGAPIDVVKAVDKLMATGKLSADDIGHKIPYVLAMTMTTAMIGSTLNYLFTGQGPQELKDYFFPRTGGTTNRGTPERVSLPSYVKDIYEYSQRPGQTIANKLNPIFGILSSIWSNQDFFGDPIADPEDPDYKQLADKARYAARESTPFSIQGTKQIAGAEADDAMGKVKRVVPFIGVTPAPGYITSPDQIDRMSRYQQEQKYSKELKYKLNQAIKTGDKETIEDYKQQYIQSRERTKQLELGMKMDKAKAAAARLKHATSMRRAGYPATASLVESLPLQMDSEARSYFAKVAGEA